MELTGKVELDKDSMTKLKDSIREEVINQINENGLMLGEVKKFLNSLDMPGYFNLFTKTLENAIAAGEKQKQNEDFHFDDGKKFRVLKTIQELINLSEIKR